MLKLPNEYELTKINLSNSKAYVNDLYFDSAIILFTPKVANKGVDIATLQCTIVQIIDRGEWGKEEVEFTVESSSFNNRKRREFDLSADAGYSLKIIPPPELRMGILEIYFDPEYSTSSTMSPSNNPYTASAISSADITAGMIAAAPQIAAAIGSESRAAMAEQFDKETARNTVENLFTVKAWSGNANDHIILPASTNRVGIKSSSPGLHPVHINMGNPPGLKATEYDDTMTKDGTWYSLPNERLLPLLMWLDAGKANQQVSVTELLP